MLVSEGDGRFGDVTISLSLNTVEPKGQEQIQHQCNQNRYS